VAAPFSCGGLEPKAELEKQGYIRFPTECWVALIVDGWEYHRAPMAERKLFSEAPDPDDAASGEKGHLHRTGRVKRSPTPPADVLSLLCMLLFGVLRHLLRVGPLFFILTTPTRTRRHLSRLKPNRCVAISNRRATSMNELNDRSRLGADGSYAFCRRAPHISTPDNQSKRRHETLK
jgi:hypothetical protein